MELDLRESQSIFIRVVWLCAITLCFAVLTFKVHAAQPMDPDAEAPDRATSGSGNQTLDNQPWQPPPPPPDKFDWIQLTSGEWLKGELKRLYERKLEFDSKELDLQEFDWEDVKLVRGGRIFSVRFVGPITVDGMLQVTEDKVILAVGGEQQEFRRDRLVAIAPGGDRELDYWSAKISFGFNFSRGNSDETNFSGTANIKRRTSATRVILDYLGNITRTRNVETVNNHRVSGSFDVFKTRKYFYRPVFGEYFRDPFKNIDNRFTLGAGAGYHIINTPKTEWEIAGGPAFQTTQFVTVEPGQASSEWTPAFVAGTHFETELTKRVDFDFLYNFQILNEASGTYTHHLVTTFETELTKLLDFDISFVWDRVQNPTPEADGTIPKQDDFYLIFALGIDI